MMSYSRYLYSTGILAEVARAQAYPDSLAVKKLGRWVQSRLSASQV